MPANRSGQVVVITGASSGIGRATALRFAAPGTKLVLVSRREDKLAEVAKACETKGATCFIGAADVGNYESLKTVTDQALEKFGRIDVWVNNAGVGSLGSFTAIAVEEHRRIIETNLLGYIYGAHLALNVFKKQKSGTLVNNASVVARLATPSLTTYITSKFAVRGLTHALRQDLKLEGFSDVHVCQVNPGMVDTPAFRHAMNHTGRPVPMRVPMSTPEAVASKIERLTRHPKREVYVGFAAWLGGLAYTLLPGFTAWVLCLATKIYYRRTLPQDT